MTTQSLQKKYTYVETELQPQYNAPHTFIVRNAETNDKIQDIHFQEGPIKEVGVNGVNNEDLILMIITRLESFQNSDFKCDENELALNHLYGAIDALRSRTNARNARGVEGTSKI